MRHSLAIILVAALILSGCQTRFNPLSDRSLFLGRHTPTCIQECHDRRILSDSLLVIEALAKSYDLHPVQDTSIGPEFHLERHEWIIEGGGKEDRLYVTLDLVPSRGQNSMSIHPGKSRTLSKKTEAFLAQLIARLRQRNDQDDLDWGNTYTFYLF